MEAFSLVSFQPPVLSENGKAAPSTFQAGAPPVNVKKRRDASEEVKKVLNTILPPREFQEGGQFWIQYVCPAAANR